MQGTIVMLMALSGLGCHHKSCDVAYAPSCYSGGCYGGCYSRRLCDGRRAVVLFELLQRRLFGLLQRLLLRPAATAAAMMAATAATAAAMAAATAAGSTAGCSRASSVASAASSAVTIVADATIAAVIADSCYSSCYSRATGGLRGLFAGGLRLEHADLPDADVERAVCRSDVLRPGVRGPGHGPGGSRRRQAGRPGLDQAGGDLGAVAPPAGDVAPTPPTPTPAPPTPAPPVPSAVKPKA